jgi:histidinol dehydrogenase
MVKVLNSSNRVFDRELDKLLSARKSKVQSSSISVTNIIKDVKKNGDKALLKIRKKI